MKKLLALGALALIASGAQAATYNLVGGSNDLFCITSAGSSPNPAFPVCTGLGYDGEVHITDPSYTATIQTSGSTVTSGTINWSGTFTTDVGLGAPATQAIWFTNSTNGSYDLITGVQTGTWSCTDGPFNFNACAAETQADWNLTDGVVSFTDNGNGTVTLIMTSSVFTGGTGKYDLYSKWTLGTAVPVPAAVWLFGSALGLLGWARRRAA